MKRSEINRFQQEAVDFFQKHNFYLPKWAFWSKETWQAKGDLASEIVEKKLGWDITDFGLGDYEKHGLLLFFPNENAREAQVTPWHFHWVKTEDIINRGGGNLVIQLKNSGNDGKFTDSQVHVQIDGIAHTLNQNGKITLEPGESICIPPYLYHTFYGESGTVLVGEVSSVNDDEKDNRFQENLGRFPKIEEDEPLLFLLCNEYSHL